MYSLIVCKKHQRCWIRTLSNYNIVEKINVVELAAIFGIIVFSCWCHTIRCVSRVYFPFIYLSYNVMMFVLCISVASNRDMTFDSCLFPLNTFSVTILILWGKYFINVLIIYFRTKYRENTMQHKIIFLADNLNLAFLILCYYEGNYNLLKQYGKTCD